MRPSLSTFDMQPVQALFFPSSSNILACLSGTITRDSSWNLAICFSIFGCSLCPEDSHIKMATWSNSSGFTFTTFGNSCW